mmetsp:Transcript_50730/g.84159  ORF Transcript_50730/g.84159 Transcript_50730/m.84159 type:complete len:209 (-) Transcript_50730:183-809(-)
MRAPAQGNAEATLLLTNDLLCLSLLTVITLHTLRPLVPLPSPPLLRSPLYPLHTPRPRPLVRPSTRNTAQAIRLPPRPCLLRGQLRPLLSQTPRDLPLSPLRQPPSASATSCPLAKLLPRRSCSLKNDPTNQRQSPCLQTASTPRCHARGSSAREENQSVMTFFLRLTPTTSSSLACTVVSVVSSRPLNGAVGLMASNHCATPVASSS